MSCEDYATILDGPRAVVPPPQVDDLTDAYAEPPFAEIVRFLGKSGLKLSERMIRRYHAPVRTRGFVISRGRIGIGKTWLAETYAEAVGAERCIVPVAPQLEQ